MERRRQEITLLQCNTRRAVANIPTLANTTQVNEIFIDVITKLGNCLAIARDIKIYYIQANPEGKKQLNIF